MTSVIGIDVGNLASKIGIARNRGIDILTNEVSNRATPTLVSFGARSRAIGETAKTLETSNFRNTIGSLKRLIGRSLSDPEVEYERQFINAELVDVNGSVGVKVQYLGEPAVFSATQLYAMYLGRLRDTAAAESKAAVNDVVIAVPGWYNDRQRRAVLDAAEVANLHPLRLINDTTATALGHGVSRFDLPEKGEAPRYVVFVDIGHSDYSVSIVAYNQGQLVVKSTAYDEHFGGREFDLALVNHFAEEFKGKYKVDVSSNPKALFRLATNVEKLKKILSANANAPLNVESLMDDIDASSSLSRETFEQLIQPLLDRAVQPLERALQEANLSKDDIHSIELVGGSTRVPAIKDIISEFFGKPLSFTSNQDEAIARGATFTCASLSPVFRARDFEITDIVNYPIGIKWEATPESQDDGTSLCAFERGNSMPSTKMLTFYRNNNFDLEAHYAKPIKGQNPFIARYTVKDVKPAPNGDPSQVRVRVRVNPNGILDFGPPTLVEEVEPSLGESTPGTATPMDTEQPAAPAEKQDDTTPAENSPAPDQPAKKARKTVKHELPGVAGTTALDNSLITEMREREGEMHSSDKLVAETDEKKNALEEYIYDLREKLEGAWAAFATQDIKDSLRSKSLDAEDWLYSEEGEDAKKSEYAGKLDELKNGGETIRFRAREFEERPAAERTLREAISNFNAAATSGDEKYSHLSEEELQKVIEKCANTEKWMSDMAAKQAERPKNVDAATTTAEIKKKREQLVYDVTPILNKPKPKAPVNPNPQTPPNGAGKEETKKADEEMEVEENNDADKADKTKQSQMDVD